MPRHWWYIAGFVMILLSFIVPRHAVSNADLLGSIGILIVAMYSLTDRDRQRKV